MIYVLIYEITKIPSKFGFECYTPTQDTAYCLPCYLFNSKHGVRNGTNAFTVKGFNNWKKVNAGKSGAFLHHVGEDPCSPHNNAVRCCQILLNKSQHIDKIMNAQSSEKKKAIAYESKLQLMWFDG